MREDKNRLKNFLNKQIKNLDYELSALYNEANRHQEQGEAIKRLIASHEALIKDLKGLIK